MDYELFNQTVIEHKNMLILFAILTLIFIIFGALVIEFYVRRSLDCQFFKIGKLKFSPTLLMIIPIVFVVLLYSIKIYQCNKDIKEAAYLEYVGTIEYSGPSVKLTDNDLSIFVGKGYEKVPRGISIGKVIYSKRSKVIVYYNSIKQTDE